MEETQSGSMERVPPSEADSCSASQQLSQFLRNPKFTAMFTEAYLEPDESSPHCRTLFP
jgi:hypothetical protein